jgi:hypothetical protein
MKPTYALISSLFLVAIASSPARAGGLGIVATGGMHTDRAYYYNSEGQQGIDNQTQPQAGLGIEGLLGDRDDKILGLMRVYWLRDSPPDTPDTQGVQDPVYPDYASLGPRDIGVAEIGIQWGLLGDPAGLQLTLTTLVGTGFITDDSTEFFLGDAGVGGTYAIGEGLQLYANIGMNIRHRKIVSYGPAAYAGVRYLFD